MAQLDLSWIEKLIKSKEEYMKKEKLWTLNETAEIFGVSTTTIHNWINAGKLKYYQRAKTYKIYVPQKYIDEFKNGRMRENENAK